MSNQYIPRDKGAEAYELLCGKCMGFRKLCGARICPLVTNARKVLGINPISDKTEFFGASPPATFVGTYGYPKVFVGPLLPPAEIGDTSLYDDETQWVDQTIDELITLRLSLLRGKEALPVNSAAEPPSKLETIQELSLSIKSVDTEIKFSKSPRQITFTSRAPPSGPSGLIEKMKLAENPYVEKPVERVFGDTDLKAGEGIVDLADDKIPHRQIVRMLSVGMLGVGENRKMVPTQWSITAVDDILSKDVMKRVKTYPWINDFYVFSHTALGNHVAALLIPGEFNFEALEVWPRGGTFNIMQDYEFFQGRKKYAFTIAGAYYATRLPILNYLDKIRRQATIIIMMEIDESWVPLGVWRFREILKQAIENGPAIFTDKKDALDFLRPKMMVPLEAHLAKSVIYNTWSTQTRLDQFFD